MPKRAVARNLSANLKIRRSGASKLERRTVPKKQKKRTGSTKHSSMPLVESARVRFEALKEPAKEIIKNLFASHPYQSVLIQQFGKGLNDRIEDLTTALANLGAMKNDQQSWKGVKAQTKEIINHILDFVESTQEKIQDEAHSNVFVVEFLIAMFRGTYTSCQGVKPVFIKSIYDTLGDVLTLQILCRRFAFLAEMGKGRVWESTANGFGDAEVKILESLRWEVWSRVIQFKFKSEGPGEDDDRDDSVSISMSESLSTDIADTDTDMNVNPEPVSVQLQRQRQPQPQFQPQSQSYPSFVQPPQLESPVPFLNESIQPSPVYMNNAPLTNYYQVPYSTIPDCCNSMDMAPYYNSTSMNHTYWNGEVHRSDINWSEVMPSANGLPLGKAVPPSLWQSMG